MTSEEDNEEGGDMCCASCGIAEIDDIKLRNVMAVISYAAMNVRKIIKQSTKKTAKSERLNYVMSCYSSSQKVLIRVTAQSAVYLCRLIR